MWLSRVSAHCTENSVVNGRAISGLQKMLAQSHLKVLCLSMLKAATTSSAPAVA